jgi:hypothetical protein
LQKTSAKAAPLLERQAKVFCRRFGHNRVAVELQEVEGVQNGLADGAVPVERVEDRDAVRTAHHRLAAETYPFRRPVSDGGMGEV